MVVCKMRVRVKYGLLHKLCNLPTFKLPDMDWIGLGGMTVTPFLNW